jgi:hypothetical protein
VVVFVVFGQADDGDVVVVVDVAVAFSDEVPRPKVKLPKTEDCPGHDLIVFMDVDHCHLNNIL